MKRTITVLWMGLIAAGAASAGEQVTQIKVSGLFCASCPYIAAEAMKKVESVEIVDSKFNSETQSSTFVVKYDDAITTPEDIAALPLSYGYEATVLAADAAES